VVAVEAAVEALVKGVDVVSVVALSTGVKGVIGWSGDPVSDGAADAISTALLISEGAGVATEGGSVSDGAVGAFWLVVEERTGFGGKEGGVC
jgi:hypothetical protein